jgi:Uri superfamily endonuclease
MDKHIILLGEEISTGCYLLRIQMKQDREVRFGRHNKGGASFLPEGEYLYIGSALGQKGASSLGHRLMRHLTRCGDAPPHPLRERLFDQLVNAGLATKVPELKKCHWHIDYLLEIPEAEVSGILILRSRKNHEKAIARALESLPETSIPVPGLGASDHPGGTHLFALHADEVWWDRLPEFLPGIADLDDGMAKI